jgi:hypothetical protein
LIINGSSLELCYILIQKYLALMNKITPLLAGSCLY